MTPTAFTFNPPPASEIELAEPTPQRVPYALRRVVLNPSGRVHGRRHGGPAPRRGEEDTRPYRYFVYCKRASNARHACFDELEVYRVVTGTHAVEPVGQVEDVVYYWADDALVIEQGSAMGTRLLQTPFCSWKCLSLFSAKVVRDTE